MNTFIAFFRQHSKKFDFIQDVLIGAVLLAYGVQTGNPSSSGH